MGEKLKKQIFTGSQAVNDMSNKIIEQREVIRGLNNTVRQLSESYRTMDKSSPDRVGLKTKIDSVKSSLLKEKDTLSGLQIAHSNSRLSVKKLRDEYALYDERAARTVNVNNGLGGSFKSILVGIGGVYAIKELGNAIVSTRAKMQSLEKSYESLLNSEVKAKEMLADIKDYAIISPLTVSDISSSVQTLLGFNVEAEKTMGIIKNIGDVSMGESGKFASLTLAFAQMSATGKLMGQDLNQMINAGFNPLQEISRVTGKSISLLKDEMGKGAVTSEMVANAFRTATEEGGKFYGMTEKASKGISSAQSNLQNAIDEMLNDFGKNSEELITGSYDVTTKMVQNYETVGKILVGLVATYGTYRTALIINAVAEQGVNKAVWSKIIATKTAIAVQTAYNTVLSLNPYVKIT